MVCAPHTYQSVQLSLGVTLPQRGQYSLRQVPAGLAYLRDLQYVHFILLRWSWDDGESLHLCILMPPPRRCLCHWGSGAPVSNFVPNAAVYPTAIMNTEGMTQRQIKSVHLEDAVRNPPSRHTISSSRLRQHWGQETLSLAYARVLVSPRVAPGLSPGYSDIQAPCRFG